MSSLGVCSLEASEGSSEKIVLNVGGVKHETLRTTLMSLPGSRLAELVNTEKSPSVLFFDRHPEVFAHVLQYYRSGKLHCPSNLCGLLMEEEFTFWGISSADVEPCCWETFQQNKETLKALAGIKPSVMKKEEESGQKQQSSSSRGWQRKIWALFDKPYSSVCARIIAVISLFFILLSIIAFSLWTLPSINSHQLLNAWASNSTDDFSRTRPPEAQALDTVEIVCSIWFVFEFVIRAGSCPSKLWFFINVMNIVDLLALFPWFFRWSSNSFSVFALGFLHAMRCIRLLRVFKLMQHVFGVRVLTHTLRASLTSLCIVPLLLSICTLIFGTMFYFAELTHKDSYISSSSSLDGFWWALVTLTTVGYGDMLPVTRQGKCVAFLCAMVGVLLIVLPVPIIVNNFLKFSSLVKTKHSMPRMKEKMNVNAGPTSSA